jgi:hypothetical protein
MRVKLTEMLGQPVAVFTEEVRCRKNVRALLPGEPCPPGHGCKRPVEL